MWPLARQSGAPPPVSGLRWPGPAGCPWVDQVRPGRGPAAGAQRPVSGHRAQGTRTTRHEARGVSRDKAQSTKVKARVLTGQRSVPAPPAVRSAFCIWGSQPVVRTQFGFRGHPSPNEKLPLPCGVACRHVRPQAPTGQVRPVRPAPVGPLGLTSSFAARCVCGLGSGPRGRGV